MKEEKAFKIDHLFYEKRFQLLKSIVDGNLYAAGILRNTKVSSHHVWQSLRIFEQSDLIYRPIVWGKKMRPLSLTKKGRATYDSISAIIEKLGAQNESMRNL